MPLKAKSAETYPVLIRRKPTLCTAGRTAHPPACSGPCWKKSLSSTGASGHGKNASLYAKIPRRPRENAVSGRGRRPCGTWNIRRLRLCHALSRTVTPQRRSEQIRAEKKKEYIPHRPRPLRRAPASCRLAAGKKPPFRHRPTAHRRVSPLRCPGKRRFPPI